MSIFTVGANGVQAWHISKTAFWGDLGDGLLRFVGR